MKGKILVTGGAGYIGSFMVEALKQKGFEPHILDNMSYAHIKAVEGYPLKKLDLSTNEKELEDYLAQEKFDAVVHMASFIQVGESYKNPAKYYINNVVGFLNLLNAMVKVGTKKLILSSTAAVYGIPEKLPISENDRKEPINPYGQTKYIMEKMLSDYDDAYQLKSVSIRYFNAAGAALDGTKGEDHADESHLIPNIIKKTIKGEEVYIFGDNYNTPDGTCIRDYVHVLDLCENHALALEYLLSGNNSNIFNAGSGRGYSNKEIINEIEKVTGKKVKVKYVEKREGDSDKLLADIEKIKRILNWKPKYSITEIIESAYKWHTNNPNGYND